MRIGQVLFLSAREKARQISVFFLAMVTIKDLRRFDILPGEILDVFRFILGPSNLTRFFLNQFKTASQMLGCFVRLRSLGEFVEG